MADLSLVLPVEQTSYNLPAQLVGWAYHSSNGLTFGVMCIAMVGGASKRGWGWAVVFAVGLELAMLFTPYASFFGIPPTAKFIVVTLLAHLVFGLVMGLVAQCLWDLFRPLTIR